MVVLFGEVQERTGDSGIIRDESSVEAGKAKEGLYVLDFGRGWPCCNAIKFDRVHGKLTRFYNHPKVFDFRNIELAFLKL